MRLNRKRTLFNRLLNPLGRCIVPKKVIALALLILLSLVFSLSLKADTSSPVLRVVVMDNFPPLIYASESGSARGLIPERWALWQAKTGQAVEITPLEWSLALSEFDSGQFDVIDAITWTPERQEKYLFSQPWITLDVVLYYRNQISGISDAASAQGFQIGVVKGDACAAHLERQGLDNLAFFAAYADVVEAAARGVISVFCGHQLMTNYFLGQRGVADQFLHTAPLYSAPGHWAVRSDQPELLVQIQRGFQQISEQDEQSLRDKWLGRAVATPLIPIWVTWLFYGVLALLAVLLVILLWLRTLRRLVIQRTQELENYQTHLEELVGQRTQELTALTEDLQQSGKEQQAVFDTAMVGILLLHDQKIMRCNRSLEQMLGFASGELIGQTPALWFAQEQSFREVDERLWRAVAAQGFFSEELALRHQQGQTIWVRLQVQAIDPQDLSQGVAGVLIDMSAEYAAREQMQEAQRLAEEAVRTKSDFLANMSHEIRTPMNAILGMTHLLLQTPLEAEQRNYLEKIHRSGRHLLGVINDILDFSKIEAGKLVLEQMTFNLHTLLQDLLETLQPAASQKGLALKLDLDPRLPEWCLGDPLRLQQILLNFGNNAVKFTEVGQITLSVQVLARQGEVYSLRFSVADSGIGLSEAQQAKLFRSFEQADTSITRKYGGSGLGLAISRQLVELMAGKIGVLSELGQGATFWFQIELNAVVDAQAIQQARREMQAEVSGRDSERVHLNRHAKILLVEDNALNQEVALALLKPLGVRVDLAENGAEALSALEQQSYDLVLMDVQMPVMDGLTATRKIREMPKWRDLPIIAMTASVLMSDREACEAAGMNAHLPKPIEPRELWKVLITWLPATPENTDTTSAPIAVAAPAPEPTQLPQIEGLDTELGLRLVMRDQALYRLLLQSFVSSHQETAQELTAAVAQQDVKTAVRLVHTLKGSLAQLGATHLAACAQTYEQSLKQAQEQAIDLPQLRTHFLQGLTHLLSALTDFLQQHPDTTSFSPTEQASFSISSDQELYQFLKALLAQDDVRALKLLQQESARWRSILGDAYSQVLEKVERFEFAEALAQLD